MRRRFKPASILLNKQAGEEMRTELQLPYQGEDQTR